MSHEEILAQFYETVWTRGDVAALDRFFAPDAAAGGLMPDMALSVEDMKTLVEAALALVEKPRVRILRSIGDGEWLSALIHVECRARHTAQPLTLNGQVMMRFRDGRIAEAYNHFDTLGFFQDLGVLPPNLVEMALAGEAVS